MRVLVAISCNILIGCRSATCFASPSPLQALQHARCLRLWNETPNHWYAKLLRRKTHGWRRDPRDANWLEAAGPYARTWGGSSRAGSDVFRWRPSTGQRETLEFYDPGFRLRPIMGRRFLGSCCPPPPPFMNPAWPATSHSLTRKSSKKRRTTHRSQILLCGCRAQPRA